MLHDRHAECGVLDRVLHDARAGRSAVLVVRGEPGVGKSALLRYVRETGSDFQIVRVTGVESEMELPFAGLHQLCGPLMDRAGGLPEPQRAALATSLGLSSGAPPDPFLVGLAVLTLVSEIAGEQLVLCLIDDFHWLDRVSAKILAFVARRLHAEPVGVVFATRNARIDELAGLPQLALSGLPNTDARVLLDALIPGPVDAHVRDRIIAEAQGNPLALRELGRASTPDGLAGGFALPDVVPLARRIEASFRNRIEQLPSDTQLLVLVAAAEPLGDPALFWHAASRLGLASEAAFPAESHGLIRVTGRVTFDHPLVRSAVYHSAAASDRRRVHAALAAVTHPEVDPDRRAWHRAHATAGFDEHVATELERAADRAQARGGLAAAAAFLDQAARLTPDPAHRAERALAAAHAKYQAGALDAAAGVLATAEGGPLDDAQRARVVLLHALIDYASERGNRAAPLLLKAAWAYHTIDVDVARETYLEAISAAMFAGRLAVGGGIVEVSEAARAAPRPRRLGPAELLLDGLATRFTDGYRAAAPILRDALTAFRSAPHVHPNEVRWLWLACWAAADLWDDEAWTILATTQLEIARTVGALTSMPIVLSTRSHVHAISGELDEAIALHQEMEIVADAIGSRRLLHLGLWIAVLQGRENDAAQLREATINDAMARGEGLALTSAEFATAILNNSLGRYDAALSEARRATERTDEISGTRALPELVEAATRSGNTELAQAALERLGGIARASETDWVVGVEARSRALLSQGETAETLYRKAIDRVGRTRIRLDLARAHLLYGEWLRRQRRRADARDQLRSAHELFTTMGMQAFAERAARELLATGERARARTVETLRELTPQEAQIARLARDGLSNPEIGARLYISARTVEYHLRKVFTKLDISSRSELSTALEPEASLRTAHRSMRRHLAHDGDEVDHPKR